MSEIYQAGETASPASEAGSTAPYDAGSGPASADNAGSYSDAAPGGDFAGYSDADIDAILAAEDQLPEPRTRQEAAAATWDDTTRPGDDDPGSFSGDPASEYDGDVAALLAAEDQLPEPRTRQEAAAATWDDTSTSQDDGLGTSTDGTSPSQPDASTEPPARHDENEDGTPDPYEHQVAVHTADGTDVPVTVEYMPPEARTVGDTTPTGIGRKPTGEEFLDMESDDPFEGRFDRFITEAVKEGPDVRDAFGNAAETLHDLRLPGPAHGGGHARESQPVHAPAPPAGPAFSDLFGSAALVGVAMLTGIRYGFRQLGKGDRR